MEEQLNEMSEEIAEMRAKRRGSLGRDSITSSSFMGRRMSVAAAGAPGASPALRRRSVALDGAGGELRKASIAPGTPGLSRRRDSFRRRA